MCLILANTLGLCRVKAESSSSTIIMDEWTTQADSQQAATITEVNQSDDESNSKIGSVDNNGSDDSQTSDDEQEKKENEKKDSKDNTILGIIIGGLLTLAGTAVTSVFNSKEASKQRTFQLKNEGIVRKEERKKELTLYKRKVYIDYIQSLRKMNSFIYNNASYTPNEFGEYEKQVIECNACVSLIGSDDVMAKAGEIARSVRQGMSVISDNKILELVELMRKDIEMESSPEQHDVPAGNGV